MKYRSDNDNLKAHIVTLRVVIVGLFLGCLLMWQSAEQAKSVQRIYLPPDLRSGSTTEINTVPVTTVYAFALNIYQLLNTWKDDGATDYPENIRKLGAYFTPEYREWLNDDAIKRKSNGELLNRTRVAIPANGTAFDDRRVEIIDGHNWVVWLDMEIKEYQKGLEVKSVTLRYPVKVVHVDISPDLNPWALQLNGYKSSPKRITSGAKKQ